MLKRGLYKLILTENPERGWAVGRKVVPHVMRVIAPCAGYGAERMPLTGGFVLASNHFSGIDPTLIGSFSPRTLYYMAKIELLEVPVAGELLRWCGAFAVRRGEGDRDSVRVARWAVAHGHGVGIFVEGTRQPFGYPGPVQPGGVMIAIQEGVPVVPCGLDSFGWTIKNRRRCAVVFGDPIDLSGLPKGGRGYKEAAAIVERRITELWRQAAQAVADGFPDELPDGTPRTPILRGASGFELPELEPWPTEEWAAGPLGPVYPGAR